VARSRGVVPGVVNGYRGARDEGHGPGDRSSRVNGCEPPSRLQDGRCPMIAPRAGQRDDHHRVAPPLPGRPACGPKPGSGVHRPELLWRHGPEPGQVDGCAGDQPLVIQLGRVRPGPGMPEVFRRRRPAGRPLQRDPPQGGSGRRACVGAACLPRSRCRARSTAPASARRGMATSRSSSAVLEMSSVVPIRRARLVGGVRADAGCGRAR